MRIAYLLADHGVPVYGTKGASVHVRELAAALADRGHEVTIFCTRKGAVPDEVPFSIVKAPSVSGDETVPDSDPQALRRVKERRYMASADNLLRHFLQAHRQHPFDVIYERYSLWSAVGVRAARETGLPVVLDVNAPLCLEQASYRELCHAGHAKALERENFQGADRLIAVSRAVADYLLDHGAREETVTVMPNGVNTALFHPAVAPAALPEAEGRFVVAFSGSLKSWHGIDILMDAFRELVRRHAGLHLLMIGDGPLGQWLAGFAAGARLDDQVSFTGWVPHGSLPPLLARADAAVAPYPPLEDFYFSPLKLFEYLALGRPVVASAIGQITEVIEHGRNGLLVPPGDALALADALERLYLDLPLRKRLGLAAAEDAEQRGWNENARRLEAILASLRGARTPQEARK